jgi:hypothetical protein
VRTIRNTQIHCVGRKQSSVIYINSARTSQETHYISATKTNRLMLIRETVAVYCEHHMEHTNTLCVGRKQSSVIYINSARTSQETHYISASKSNRLLLFRETVAVYFEKQSVRFPVFKVGIVTSVQGLTTERTPMWYIFLPVPQHI